MNLRKRTAIDYKSMARISENTAEKIPKKRKNVDMLTSVALRAKKCKATSNVRTHTLVKKDSFGTKQVRQANTEHKRNDENNLNRIDVLSSA